MSIFSMSCKYAPVYIWTIHPDFCSVMNDCALILCDYGNLDQVAFDIALI